MKWFIGLICLHLSAGEVVKEADAKALTAIVSFLASDALEGRETPSAGLTIAGEYIASEFRRTGLQPVLNGSYFQEAKVRLLRVSRDGFDVSFQEGERTLTLPLETAFWNAAPKLELAEAAVRKMTVAELKDFNQEKIEAVVVLEPGGPMEGRMGGMIQQGLLKLGKAGAKLAIMLSLPMPLAQQTLEFDDQPKSELIILRSTDEAANEFLKALPIGVTAAKAKVKIPGAVVKADVVRNVIGVLPGSDPKLKDEYIVVSAHYDHLGMRPNDSGDRIFNGANDDASGTASMLESARLLAQLPVAPKRSVLFVAFFGEERGLLGSRYLGRHPVVPLPQIVANLNLEQTGRTDSSEGPNVGQANLTGYDFTDIHGYLEAAGKETGLKIVKDEKLSDPYFVASDNAALALLGVPSTTLSVTYEYPDYHQKGDEWEKLDYANMAKVTRTAAQAAYLMADAPERVKWNEAEPKVKSFVEAAKKLRN